MDRGRDLRGWFLVDEVIISMVPVRATLRPTVLPGRLLVDP